MENKEQREPRPVRVTDRRGASRSPAGEGDATPTLKDGNGNELAGEDIGAPETPAEEAPAEEERAETVPLEDYLRLQADFDNRRKRLMREAAMASDRAKRELLERLLPLLDNFDRALEHDDGSKGLELLHRELLSTLESEGLEEIEAEGKLFDPHVHDAVESHASADVDDTVVKVVYRKGYQLGGHVLRPAMVVVSHPLKSEGSDEETTDERAEG